ncbi:MAG TPA: hypothetical protein VJM08_06885 [Anaerolineales bacterium]|nr:hypothetical protein [Anaerolineales bacterium]
METRSTQSTERLAKISRTLGILSVGLIILAFGIWIWLTFFGGPADEPSGFALSSLIAILFLGGLILGVAGLITALIALRRNREEGDAPVIKGIANVGLRLSILSVAIVVILFAYILLFAQRTPPEPTPPFPATAIP